MEAAKESNQTSHFFPSKPTLIYCMWNEDKADQHGNFSTNDLCPWRVSTKLRWKDMMNLSCLHRMSTLLIAKYLHFVVHKMGTHFEDTQW